MAIAMLRARVVVAVALAGCGNRHRDSSDNAPPPHDAPRARRVIEPSTDRVGPLPPYAIRADGVGPYRLGEKLSDLLEHLASGPRIELFEIPGVVHRNVIRAEDDTILVGGEQASTASFVAVVGSEVARTESGVHVGSTRDEVIAALGPAQDDAERARDPRLLVPSALPSLRAVLDGDRVAAIVVASPPMPPRRTTECPRPAATDKAFGACMTSTGELIEVTGDEIVIRSAEGERALAAPPRFPGLVFAAPLRGAADARDELVVVSRSDELATRSWWISAYRFEGARLVRTVDATQVYQLSSANARWIGAGLRDVELYLELTSRPDAIEVGGLLTTLSPPRKATKIRDVVVISPAEVTRRHGRPPVAAEPSDAAGAAPQQPSRVPTDAALDARDPAGAESGQEKP